MMSYIYQYVPEFMFHKEEVYTDVVHVIGDSGHPDSNLIAYSKTATYTDVNSFIVPDISTLTSSENPHVIEFFVEASSSSSGSN